MWIYINFYWLLAFVLWVALSLAVGFIGRSRTIGARKAFLISVFLSPLIGLIVTLTAKKPEPPRPITLETLLEDARKEEQQSNYANAWAYYTRALSMSERAGNYNVEHIRDKIKETFLKRHF